MSWSPGDGDHDSQSPDFEDLPLRRDAPRPATILRCADEMERRGGEVRELFKEIESPQGQAVFPIHLSQNGREYFIEVETGPWERPVVEATLRRALILRSSESSGAGIRLLSAYPVPEEVRFLTGGGPAALLQLDLTTARAADPEEAAGTFRESAGRRWGADLDFTLDSLPLIEELLLAAFRGEERDLRPPILDGLVCGLGCFLGETIRRELEKEGLTCSWETSEESGVALSCGGYLLDVIGKSRAFLSEGSRDSISFYAKYALEELGRAGE